MNQLSGNNTTGSAETVTISLPVGRFKLIFVYRDFSLNDSWPNYDNRITRFWHMTRLL